MTSGVNIPAHTPGPWFVGAQNDMLYVIAGAEPAVSNDHPDHERDDRAPLAKVYDHADGFVPDWETASANARLIAAAPDLLALLKRYRDETPLGHQPHMIAAEADAAIAKAEGR